MPDPDLIATHEDLIALPVASVFRDAADVLWYVWLPGRRRPVAAHSRFKCDYPVLPARVEYVPGRQPEGALW